MARTMSLLTAKVSYCCWFTLPLDSVSQLQLAMLEQSQYLKISKLRNH